MFQHVNNVSQQMYFDLGKADFYRQVLQDDVLSGTSRIITAATANSFKEQIRMEDDIYVTTTVAKVGNKSITLFQQIIGRNAAARIFDAQRLSAFLINADTALACILEGIGQQLFEHKSQPLFIGDHPHMDGRITEAQLARNKLARETFDALC